MSAPHRQRPALLAELIARCRIALSRRTLLKGLGAMGLGAGASAVLSACGVSSSPQGGEPVGDMPQTPEPPVPPAPGTFDFQHGVASGDPLADAVIVWTRVTPGSPDTAGTVPVDYVLATDPELSNVATSGSAVTDATRDFTVKVDVNGLTAGTTYYYQFSIGEAVSPIGRTRTAPAGDAADRARFAVVACSNYSFGFFNGFGAIAQRRDLDAVIHLGDYLYETAGGSVRQHEPDLEIVTLDEYRQRFAQYRQDPDLQEAHRQHPFIAIWDDHETTNNSYRDGAANHQPDTEGDWFERKGRAVRAYFEWMPVRDNVPLQPANFDAPADAAAMDGLLPEGNGSIQRVLRYGNLLDLIMLDTRLAGRVVQNGTDIVSPEQTILGAEQREWFLGELTASTSQWKIVAQQMTFAPIKVVPLPEDQGGTFLNSDAWDGYRFDRNAVLSTIADNAIDNVVVLSGDTHVVTAFDLPMEPSDPTRYDPVTGNGSLGVEFSSNGIANVGIIGEFFMANNPHLKYSNLTLQGYLLLDVDRDRTQGEYYFTGVPQTRDATETFGRALLTADGANFLTNAALPSSERDDAPPLAP